MTTPLEAVTPTLSNKAYDILKVIALVWLPAIGALYFALGNVWHWPNMEEVLGTITAVDTFLGLLLGINTKVYNRQGPSTDGQMVVNDTGEGLVLKLQPNKNPSIMVNQDYLTFKIVHTNDPLPTLYPEENA